MRRLDASVNALPAPTAGAVLAADLRRVLAASVGLGAGVLLLVGVVAIAVREWSWDWCVWPLIAAALPWLALAVGNLVELVRGMAERIMQIDLDGDGVIGAPPARFVAINSYAGREALARDQATRDHERLAEFVRGCAVDTSLRRWETTIGRDAYVTYRDQLMAAGWAAWKRPGNERAGWALTDDAERIVDSMWS